MVYAEHSLFNVAKDAPVPGVNEMGLGGRALLHLAGKAKAWKWALGLVLLQAGVLQILCSTGVGSWSLAQISCFPIQEHQAVHLLRNVAHPVHTLLSHIIQALQTVLIGASSDISAGFYSSLVDGSQADFIHVLVYACAIYGLVSFVAATTDALAEMAALYWRLSICQAIQSRYCRSVAASASA